MTTDRCFLQDSELAGKNWKHHFLANIKACWGISSALCEENSEHYHCP